MVKFIAPLIGVTVLFNVVAAFADEDLIVRQVAGEACDERQVGDDVRTAENRALDKAGLEAIKKSGVVQEYYQNLNEQALNLISYRIIDEYLFDSQHRKTSEDNRRVCVEMKAQLEMTPDELVELINEYKYSSGPTEVQVAEIADEVNQQIKFKPQNLNEKKLLYIAPLKFWNGVETDNYREVLLESLEHSDYFFITGDRAMADYVLFPRIEEAQVDAINAKNRKMKMIAELEITALHENDFETLQEQQNHFILFAADKDEQQMADTLIKKLLGRGATALSTRLDKQIERRLEEEKLLGR